MMSQAEATAKDQMIRILEKQPADSSYEELLRELALGQMIQRGLDDIAAGRTLSHEEMKAKVDSWQK